MSPVAGEDFGNGRLAGGRRQSPAIGQPVGNEPVVLLAALWGVMRAKINIPAFQGENGLARWFVKAIRRNGSLGKLGHGATPKSPKTVLYRFGKRFRPHFPTREGIRSH